MQVRPFPGGKAAPRSVAFVRCPTGRGGQVRTIAELGPKDKTKNPGQGLHDREKKIVQKEKRYLLDRPMAFAYMK
jgi:hypothetical protein